MSIRWLSGCSAVARYCILLMPPRDHSACDQSTAGGWDSESQTHGHRDRRQMDSDSAAQPASDFPGIFANVLALVRGGPIEYGRKSPVICSDCFQTSQRQSAHACFSTFKCSHEYGVYRLCCRTQIDQSKHHLLLASRYGRRLDKRFHRGLRFLQRDTSQCNSRRLHNPDLGRVQKSSDFRSRIERVWSNSRQRT